MRNGNEGVMADPGQRSAGDKSGGHGKRRERQPATYHPTLPHSASVWTDPAKLRMLGAATAMWMLRSAAANR
jgi:hypothetical protein